MNKAILPAEDRRRLRELAKKQLEYSMLPEMKEREERWYRHNDLKGEIPMIHFETWPLEGELLPELKCETDLGRYIEHVLLSNMLNHEKIGDDKVVPGTFDIGWNRSMTLFGIEISREHSKDSMGRELGYHTLHPIKDLRNDIELLKPSVYTADKEATLEWKETVEDILGDILPVRLAMGSPSASLSQCVVHLMGMEAMIYSMIDYPNEFHVLMDRITNDHIEYFRWLEDESLLLLNNGSNLVQQGSFGYTRDLPGEGWSPEKGISLENLWLYMDSQETVSISPAMFGEFFFPYYKKIAENFGLLSYGCCEPVHGIWDKYISTMPNLRKVSISAWCDEKHMGEALKGSKVIYQRKPSPNFIGVGKELDEAAFSEHILKTLKCAQGCKLEITFRDIYTLEGNTDKPRRAVEIIRELIDRHWK